MADDIVWATSLRKPLPKWGFPSGSARDVREVDAPTKKLFEAVQADPTNEPKVRALLQAICPDATDDDWASMTPEDIQNLWDHVQQKDRAVLALVEARRKNGDAGSAGAPPSRRTRRSSRTTTRATSAPASPAPTGVTTGTPA